MPENARPFNWLPKISTDLDTGAVYVQTREGDVVRTVTAHADDDMGDYVNIDLDSSGRVVGVEIL